MEPSPLTMSLGSVEIYDSLSQRWTKKELRVATRWGMKNTLTINEAAGLAVGMDPARVDVDLERYLRSNRREFEELFLTATKEGLIKQPCGGEVYVDSLRTFMKERNLSDRFFNQSRRDIPPYLDSENDFFAPWLAIAVELWQECAGADLRNHTPSSYMKSLLYERAEKLGLLKDGKPRENAINSIVAVANWKKHTGSNE